MTHRIDRRKLGLPSDQRKHLLTNLARQFVRHGYIRTTLGRAKETQRIVEKLITAAKNDTIASRREIRKILVGHCASTPVNPKLLAGKTESEKWAVKRERSAINGEDLVKYLFDEVAPRFKERNGGYTRITKIGNRRGDGAMACVLELVD